MADVKKITQARLKELLHYDPDTGVFTWRVSRKGVKAGTTPGTRVTHGYIQIMVDGKHYLAHRLAFLYMEGEFPEEVDHRNRDPGDNRWCNLRACTHSQNKANARMHPRNASGYRGVHWRRDAKKWAASYSHDGKRKHLGLYPTAEEAHAAYLAAASKVYGEYLGETSDGKESQSPC